MWRICTLLDPIAASRSLSFSCPVDRLITSSLSGCLHPTCIACLLSFFMCTTHKGQRDRQNSSDSTYADSKDPQNLQSSSSAKVVRGARYNRARARARAKSHLQDTWRQRSSRVVCGPRGGLYVGKRHTERAVAFDNGNDLDSKRLLCF
jgi:hypothetical protein